MKRKLRFLLIFLCIIISSLILYSQTIPNDSLYLGQAPPGNTQKIFPLSVTPGYSPVERIAFSSDGEDIYYSELNIDYNYSFSSAKIKYYRYFDSKWNGPYILFEGYYSPSLSVSGDTMYIQTRNPREVWYSLKTDTVWSSPSRFMGNLDIIGNLQRTNNGTYYCTSNSNRLSKLIITPGDTLMESLGSLLNSTDDRYYLNMAKDESYAIIYTFQGGGPSLEGRALISYHKTDGGWTNPKQMGFGGWATSISPDNKFLFYSSIVGRNYATYWIRIDNIIDSLRHTNFAPYPKWPIEFQNAKVGLLFNFTVPDSTFYDDDHDSLTYSATQSNGGALPSWLTFDPVTRTFSGTPLAARALAYSIRVVATDTAHASGSYVFGLTVSNSSGVKEGKDQLPNKLMLFHNYPNPFNPTTVISYQLSASSNVKISIYNVLGQKIKTLIDTFQSAGKHSVVWDATDERNHPVSSGIFLYRLETDYLNMQKKMVLIK